MTPREQAEAMVGAIKPWITAAVAPLNAQIAALEKRISELPAPVHGNNGADGTNGKDAVVDYKWVGELLDNLVAETVAEAVKAIPIPENGRDGEPGKDGTDAEPLDMGAVSLIAEALVAEAVEKIPAPLPGKDGEIGPTGEKGDKGDSIAGPPGESAYDIAVRNGFRGGEKEWLEHLVGDPGRDGRDSVGAKGDDGEPGRDGADIDGIDLIEKDNGVRVLVLKQGDRQRELTFRVTEHVHKGAYKSDVTYYRGNEVQAGGSMFTARVDNPKGTPGNSDDWILTAKRGQNGRDLRSGERDTSKPYKLGDRS